MGLEHLPPSPEKGSMVVSCGLSEGLGQYLNRLGLNGSWRGYASARHLAFALQVHSI